MRVSVPLASTLSAPDLQTSLRACLGTVFDLPELAGRDVTVGLPPEGAADAAPPPPPGMDLLSLAVHFPYYSDEAAFTEAWAAAVHLRRGLAADGTDALCAGCFADADAGGGGGDCPLAVWGDADLDLSAEPAPAPRRAGLEKLPWPTIGAVLGGALVALGLCRALDAARPGTNHFDVFRSGLALSDFVSDLLFIFADLARDAAMRDLFLLAAACLAASFAVNLVLVLRVLRREGAGNQRFALWLQANLGAAAPVLFLSFTNVEALTILACRVVPALSAPLPERTVQRVNVLSMATNILEDIPQLAFLVLVNNRRKFWSLTSVASIMLTFVSLGLSLTKKLLAWLVLAMTKGMGAAAGDAPGREGRRQTAISLGEMRAGAGYDPRGLWIREGVQGGGRGGSVHSNPLLGTAGNAEGGRGPTPRWGRSESTQNPLSTGDWSPDA